MKLCTASSSSSLPSIASRFVESYTADTIGFVHITFPQNDVELHFTLTKDTVLTAITELTLVIFELKQLLSHLHINDNFDNEEEAENQFFKRIRFTKRDYYFVGSLIFYIASGTLTTSVRVLNTVRVSDEIKGVIDTFEKALLHCQNKSGLAFNNR